MKMIKFPSIEQFSSVVKNIKTSHDFQGLDENDKAIYQHISPYPKITFKGTVKLHGTNAGVSFCYDSNEFWVQSRKNIITPESDNAGFAFFVETKKDFFISLMKTIYEKYNIDKKNTMTIFGEWAGKGIQKNVAISEIEKSFFIFGIKISHEDENFQSYWIPINDISNYSEHKIYNIENFKTFEIEIDFENPLKSQNEMIKLMEKVEEECPVSKELGISGIGEGIVWHYMNEKNQIFNFKVKGDKHAVKSKVKKLKKVDDEKINLLIEVSEQVTPAWRLEQAVTEVFDTINGGQLDRKKIGNLIKWVISDIIKEEKHLLEEKNLEIKDISGYVANIVKNYYFSIEKENL